MCWCFELIKFWPRGSTTPLFPDVLQFSPTQSWEPTRERGALYWDIQKQTTNFLPKLGPVGESETGPGENFVYYKSFLGVFSWENKTTHENILLFWLAILIEWKQFLGGLLFISIVDFQGRLAKFSQNRYHSSKQNVTIVNSFYLNCLSLSHSHHKNVQPPPKETCINNPNYSARVPKSYLSFFPLSDKKHSLAKLFNPYHGKPSAFRPRPGSK